MTRKIICALWSVLLILALTACAPKYTSPADTYPTLPSFPNEQTPAQQLEAAIANTKNTESRTVRYGTIRKTGEETTEDAHYQTVTVSCPFDRDAMYAAAAYLPDHEDFLQNFCQLPLRAIPSNTGTVRFQITGLSWEEADRLLFVRSHGEEFAGAVCSVSMELDGLRRLCRLEVVIETQTSTVTAFLSVTFPDSP